MSQARPYRRRASHAATNLWLALSLLFIIATWAGLRQAYDRIHGNNYLSSGMQRLAAVELRKGLDAGLYFAVIVAVGAVLLLMWRQIVRGVVARGPTSALRRIAADAFALATWAAAYAAFPFAEPRLPTHFPATDIPTVAWAGIVLGSGLLLRAAVWAWFPALQGRGGWLKRPILALGIIAVVFATAVHAYARWVRPPVAAGRPNVVLIVMDTVRAQNLSLYGYKRKTTPNLDAYSSQCAVYDNAYSVAPWTIPNHASMFTGLYTSQHGARLGAPELRGVLTTAAEILCEEGFETIGYVNNPVVGGGITGFEQGFETWYMPWRRTFANLWHERNDIIRAPHDDGAYTTGRMITRWLDRRNDSRPFFLFINYLEAHAPYWPPEDYRYRFLDKHIDYQKNVCNYDWVAHASGAHVKTAEESAMSEALYDGEILYLDQRIGELLDVLRNRGLDDNTVIIITSDHGEEFGEHGLVGHAFGLYNTLLRVPLMVRFPKRLAAGRYDEAVQLVDIFPTILDGTESKHEIPARVHAISLFGGAERKEIHAENYHEYERFQESVRKRFPDADVSRYVATLRALQIGNDKLISSSARASELYQTVVDPGEHVNLAEQEPDMVRALDIAVAEWFDSTRTPLVEMERTDKTESAEIRKKLRALGYLH